MATVYKSLSRTEKRDGQRDAEDKKTRQRVLILSSRGVTYRYVCYDFSTHAPGGRPLTVNPGIDIS